MKKLLYLATLSLVATLLFASMAASQEDPCPDPDFPRETPDGCQASDLPDVPTESPTPDPTTPEPTQPQSVSCSGFASQFGAQQYYDFNATAEEQAILDPDGDGFACSSGKTGTGGDQYETPDTPPASEAPPETGTDTVLPDTGGLAFLLPAAGLLLTTGLIGLTIVRRRS